LIEGVNEAVIICCFEDYSQLSWSSNKTFWGLFLTFLQQTTALILEPTAHLLGITTRCACTHMWKDVKEMRLKVENGKRQTRCFEVWPTPGAMSKKLQAGNPLSRPRRWPPAAWAHPAVVTMWSHTPHIAISLVFVPIWITRRFYSNASSRWHLLPFIPFSATHTCTLSLIPTKLGSSYSNFECWSFVIYNRLQDVWTLLCGKVNDDEIKAQRWQKISFENHNSNPKGEVVVIR
jgi:hypothetical protein